MEADRDPKEIGARIEALLDEFTDPAAQGLAEQLTIQLVDFYGAALKRVVAVLEQEGDAGRRLLDRLAADSLMGAVLVLHDLHPEDVQERVHAALESVRPYLGSHSGDVELRGFAPDDAGGVVVTLALQGSCDGCPSSLVTVQTAIEKAIFKAAPEVSKVEVENLHVTPEPTLLQIQPCPTEELALEGVR
jgi:Fe-S cluster biogenesis protein NfuA